MDFSEIIAESKIVPAADFIELIDKAIEQIGEEEGAFDHGKIKDRLVSLKPEGEALVIGDLHGDLTSLEVIFAMSSFFEKLAADTRTNVVFLGDYGDRGSQSAELYYAVLRLKLAYPKQIFLLRGNHEGPSDLLASPHDLPIYLQRKFKEKWAPIYQRLRELFSYLYNAVYVEERYLMVHGGLSSKIQCLQEIAEAEKLHRQETLLEELLWNDPGEQIEGSYPSARGAGKVFGKAVTKVVLQRIGVKILVRGHESTRDGYSIKHEGRILTLFSSKGPPNYNHQGAFLEVPLEEKFADAYQLLPYVHTF